MPTARQQANDLRDLLRRERDALADFLVALSEFDRARRWEDLGHDSLFAFLVKDLGLSNGAAAYRRAAVDLVRRFPQVLEPIRDGRLCVTTVFELSKVITDENAAEVLPRFFGTSRRDAKNVVAELLPEPAPTRQVADAGPQKPSADPTPPCPAPPKRSRHVPSAVWRAVWERDGGRCAWPLEGGGVCGSTHKLELDHVKGFALGAGTTPHACRLLCRPHQLVSARRLYGDDLMDRYVSPKGGGCSEPAASYRLFDRKPHDPSREVLIDRETWTWTSTVVAPSARLPLLAHGRGTRVPIDHRTAGSERPPLGLAPEGATPRRYRYRFPPAR